MKVFLFLSEGPQTMEKLTGHKKILCRMETQMKHECKGNKLLHETVKKASSKDQKSHDKIEGWYMVEVE